MDRKPIELQGSYPWLWMPEEGIACGGRQQVAVGLEGTDWAPAAFGHRLHGWDPIQLLLVKGKQGPNSQAFSCVSIVKQNGNAKLVFLLQW